MDFKHLTKAEFDELTPEKQNEYAENKRKFEAEEAEKKAKQIAEDAVKEALKDTVSKEEYTKLQDALKKQGEELETIKENGGSNPMKKGELSKFFEDNAEEAKKNGGESYSDEKATKRFTVKAPALMTTANIKPVAGGAFNQLFNNYVDTEIGHTPKPDNFIMNLVNVTTQPNTEKIWWVERTNEEGDAEFVDEGELAPLVDGEYEQKNADMYELAEAWKFSKRLLSHAPSVESDFRMHANELIEQKLDDAVLLGDNSTNAKEPNGVATEAGAFIAPTALANYYPAPNIYDAINAGSTRVRLGNFKGQITCVLGTVWEAKMKGIKDKNDNYILPHFVTPDGRNVGSVRVEFQNKLPETHMLIGDLKKFNVVVGDDFEYSEFHENDDARKRLITKMLDGEYGTYIKGTDAGSIIYHPIADMLTQLEKPAV